MLLHITLSVRRSELEAFRTFEHHAARVMSKHGGAIERVLVLKTREDEPHKEVHILSFPSEDAYAAYRASPEIAAFQPMREVSVERTELAVATPGPNYGAL
jgi:uncharacterized protein (DUF1330 family)